MARTKVKGGKRRILGVLERARAVEVGVLKEECSSVFYWKVVGHRDTGMGLCGSRHRGSPVCSGVLAPECWRREPC